MFIKALWFQNYKQTKMIVGMILALFVIHMPFQAILSLETWKERLEHSHQAEDYVYEVQAWDVLQIFSQGLFPILLSISIIALACLLIGVERNTRRNDFTFSLPFHRRDLFLAKWCYGTLVIAIFHIVSFLAAYFIIYQSEFQNALYQTSLTEIFWGPLLGFIMFFTFALFIGTISGEMISQVVLTIIFGVFPIGTYFLIQGIVDIHFRTHLPEPIWLKFITPFFYVFDHAPTIPTIVLPIVFTGILLWFGIFLYERNKIEHNGEFLIFKVLNPIFLIGITICFSLLGGLIVSALAPWNADMLRIISYWIGFTLFLLFSLLISKKLLSMNVLVRSKS